MRERNAMKKQLRTSPAARAAATVLALLLGAGGFWASMFTLSQWDNIWMDADYFDSDQCYSTLYDYCGRVRQIAALTQESRWDNELSYLDQQQLKGVQDSLTAENTNFRVRLLDNNTGELLYSNLSGDTSKDALEEAVHQVLYRSISLTRESEMHGNDYFTWDGQKQWYQLHIVLPDWETVICTPDDAKLAVQYGWQLHDRYDWGYDSTMDSRVLSAELTLEYGVADPLRAEDEFMEGYQYYVQYAPFLPLIALLTLMVDIAAVAAVVFLCLGAGRRRDQERIVLRLFDKIPLDVLAVLECFLLTILIGGGGDAMFWALNNGLVSTDIIVGLALISVTTAGCLLAFLLTLTVRIKARTVFSNNLIWLLCKGIYRGCRKLVRSWSMTGRLVGLFLLYLLGTILTALTVVLAPIYQGFVLFLLCRWAVQWGAIRAGTAQIVGGNPDYKINTRKMYRDLKEHARQLNDLGGAIGVAVDERIRSERFKAELITNVSHDLKTPLTSIINYVDLLKKEQIENPKAQEYIEVLERKSQRLKKLTEDLVEASKASTGSLTVVKERLGVVQLLQQALGEFEEKFSQHRLEPVLTVLDGEVYVSADGRYLWRIIDNLLSNCYKYALEGTRIYINAGRAEDSVFFLVKNISKQQLNIPPEQLLERFVRGEGSRTTEGSGLGLSIAQSLTELQGGSFRLEIDGDLFKAIVAFPEDQSQPALD